MNIRTLSGCTLSCLCLLLAGPAGAQTFFTEVTTKALGLPPFGHARGNTFGDYDNDGWPDLFIAEGSGTVPYSIALYHNGGNNRFADRTVALPVKELPRLAGGGSVFGDYDNDGDLDLYVPVGPFQQGAELNLLLRNDRGVFIDVTLETGLTEPLPTDNAIWLDFDRDGFLDLYTGNPACVPADTTVRNRLYHNNGDGTFRDATAEAKLDVLLKRPIDPWPFCAGGSNGGMAAGDFNDDGWPDLYVGVFDDRNRLFLNDGQGHFRDATTNEIGDPGEAFGIAVGDIDNDGDLDIFQAAGGGVELLYRSVLLLNLGEGQFLDVTEGVGLSSLEAGQVLSAGLGDLDNDGDLDLLIAQPHFLFLNQGDGTFVDQTTLSGINHESLIVSFVDYDDDGFLDVGGTLPLSLYHNNGNVNHYLRVEMVGTRSNRSGIGATLVAVAGDLRQRRDIFGGMGLYQDEMVAHFGLGQRTMVDQLEVRWPSGQVDVLEDIPADQKIRLFEGRTAYHVVRPTVWETSDSLVAGTGSTFKIIVRPVLFEPGAEITAAIADLSELGGSDAAPLHEAGDGTWRLETTLKVPDTHGYKTVSVLIDQNTSLGPYWVQLSRNVAVLPAKDLLIFDEVLSPDWQEEHHRTVEIADLAHSGEVHTGRVASFFQVRGSFAGWNITFRAAEPVEPFGYTLRFAIRPGELTLPGNARFAVALTPGKSISLLDSTWMEVNRQEWQVVEVPMDAFERTGPIESISFSGNFAGTFYLDDIRLVSAASLVPLTVVEEERSASLPQAFSLSQNFPNPFNNQTVIRFELPQDSQVELAVYNIAGQQVVKLVEGVREAGRYTVRWDGRDERGRELASGIYLYRLRAGERMETRKLVLVR